MKLVILANCRVVSVKSGCLFYSINSHISQIEVPYHMESGCTLDVSKIQVRPLVSLF